MAKKIVLKKTGGFDAFSLQNDEEKKLNPDQVRIDVHYSGINFADVMMRQGLYPEAPQTPFTPGYEISGIITEVGDEVQTFRPGDKVIAGLYFGGYQSNVIVESWQVVKLPSYMSLAQGGAILVSYLTAYLTFMIHGRVKHGDRVLVDCASGALGSISAQLLRHYDCELYGLTSSSQKKEIIKERGYIPLTHQEFEEKKLDGFDIILNSRGGKTLKRDYLRLAFGGKLVGLGISDAVTGAKPNWLKVLATVFQMPKFGAVDLMNDNKSVAGVNALKVFDQKKIVIQALDDLAQFNFDPEVAKVFPPEEIGNAQQFLQDRLANGKVLISWKNN